MSILTDIGLWLDTHNWGHSFERAMGYYERLQPNWTLLMHANESHRVKPYSPHTKIIQRENDKDGLDRAIPGSGSYEKPADYAARRFKQVPLDVYILPFNEIPSLHQTEHLKWWSAWCLGFMEICLQQGRKAAIGTVPVTTLEPDQWKALHPVLNFISAHDDQFVFTVTGYSNGIMPSGINGTYPPNFRDDKGKLLPAEDWYRFNPAEWAKHVDLTKRQWIAGRITDMIVSMLNAGEDPPPCVEIEGGLDDNDDNVVQQWTKTLIKRATYNECKGWRSYKAQYEEWIKGFPAPYNALTWQQYHAYGRLWQRDVVYRPFRRKNGDCVVQSSLDFLCSTNPDWERHFNVMSDEAAAYWETIMNEPLDLPWRTQDDSEMTFPLDTDPGWKPMVNQSDAKYGVQKTIRAEPYAYILPGETFHHFEGRDYENLTIVKTNGGQIGYADRGVLVVKLPEPPPAPPPSPTLSDLIERLQAISASAFKTMNELVNEREQLERERDAAKNRLASAQAEYEEAFVRLDEKNHQIAREAAIKGIADETVRELQERLAA